MTAKSYLGILLFGTFTAAAAPLVGIGMALDVSANKSIIIRSVQSDSPADEAGLKPGDVILTVKPSPNSTAIPVTGKSIEQFATLIRGDKGIPVTLGILRSSDGRPMSVEIFRDELPEKKKN